MTTRGNSSARRCAAGLSSPRENPAARAGVRSGPVGVAAMFDAQDDDFTGFLCDPVEHAVGPAACGPDAGELAAERLADAVRIVNERGREELDDGCSDWLGKSLSKSASGGGSDDELVGLGRHRRRRRTASIPRRTSPRW